MDAVNATSTDGAVLQGPLQIKSCIAPDVCFIVNIKDTLKLNGFALPVVIGMGTGALDVTAAYEAVVADTVNWEDGRIVIMPLIYVRNPGRPNGGIFARFASILEPLGIQAVTPVLEPGGTGDAGVIPIQVDLGFEYDALNDFPAWPNPVALANTAMAAIPTYLFRDSALDELGPLASGAIAARLLQIFGLNIHPIVDGDTYVTVRADSLPLLEPLRLPLDVVNGLLGTALSNPLADALEPALRILVNLGYTDVDQDNGYLRTHDDAGTYTPFLTMPENIDWGRVLTDVVEALGTGFQDAFLSGGIPGWNSVEQPNALVNLLKMLGIEIPTLNGLLGNPLGITPAPAPPAAASARLAESPFTPTTASSFSLTEPADDAVTLPSEVATGSVPGTSGVDALTLTPDLSGVTPGGAPAPAENGQAAENGQVTGNVEVAEEDLVDADTAIDADAVLPAAG